MSDRRLFDPDAFRPLKRRTAFVRTVEHPMLVLGSTLPDELVDRPAAAGRGVEVRRRRSGGGAVLLEPDRFVWLDTWIPSEDPLFEVDVVRSRHWIGAWWARSLGDHGVAVHEGSPLVSSLSEVICFAGRASGEVTYEDRKLVGVAQWRSREGALTHSFAYVSTDWSATVGLLRLQSDPAEARSELERSTVVLARVPGLDVRGLTARLLDGLPGGGWVHTGD